MSSTDLTVFRREGVDIRVVMIDGEPHFVVTDLARMLGYRDAATAARLLRDGQKGYAEVRTPGGAQTMLVANEKGMNRLILRSNASQAEHVQDWISDEVMPSIRRTGSYSVETNEQLLARALTVATGVLAQKDEQIKALEPKAQAYDKLAGSPTLIKIEVAARKAGVGRTTAFALLRKHGIFSVYGNTPMARFAHRFEEVPATYTNRAGEEITTFTTKVRADSLVWLVSTLERLAAPKSEVSA